MIRMEEWYWARQNRQMLLTVRPLTSRASSRPDKWEVRPDLTWPDLSRQVPTWENDHNLLSLSPLLSSGLSGCSEWSPLWFRVESRYIYLRRVSSAFVILHKLDKLDIIKPFIVRTRSVSASDKFVQFSARKKRKEKTTRIMPFFERNHSLLQDISIWLLYLISAAIQWTDKDVFTFILVKNYCDWQTDWQTEWPRQPPGYDS